MLQHKVQPSDKLNEHLTGLTSSFAHTGIQSIWIQLSFMVQSSLSLLRECNRLIENDSVMHCTFELFAVETFKSTIRHVQISKIQLKLIV